MNWKNIVKFLLGVSLAIAILVGGGVAAALYFFFQVTSAPPKPIFANDKASIKAEATSASNPVNAPASPKPQTATTTPSPTPKSEALAAGTYRARVTWADGLSVRSEPNLDSERIAGAAYNEELIVLGESADKNWQRVRLENSQQEGWIKTGNIERVAAQ